MSFFVWLKRLLIENLKNNFFLVIALVQGLEKYAKLMNCRNENVNLCREHSAISSVMFQVFNRLCSPATMVKKV